MSDTVIEKLEDFDFIIQDYIYLSGQAGVGIKEEIFNNMWAFSLSEDFIRDVSLVDLQDFLSDLLEKRKEQIKELHIKSGAIFYMWIDEMLNQLRFNLLSGKDVRPPFGCTLNILDSPDSILKKFLADSQKMVKRGGSILFEDMKILEPGDEGFGEIEEEKDPKLSTLDVYVTTIP